MDTRGQREVEKGTDVASGLFEKSTIGNFNDMSKEYSENSEKDLPNKRHLSIRDT